MQGPAHLVLSWYAARAAGLDCVRDRRIVALAGIAPDIDVIAYPIGYVWLGFDLDRAYAEVWEVVHHRYTHGIGFAAFTVLIAWLLAAGGGTRVGRLRVAMLAGAISLVHVFCDLVAAGPGWPVYPLWPLSDLAWAVPWSWNVSDAPNVVITVACLISVLVHARMVGISPIETFSSALDRRVVAILTTGSDAAAGPAAMRVRIIVFGVLALVSALILIPLALGL